MEDRKQAFSCVFYRFTVPGCVGKTQRGFALGVGKKQIFYCFFLAIHSFRLCGKKAERFRIGRGKKTDSGACF